MREIVKESVAKRFDGDYNVLLKDLYPLISKRTLPASKSLASNVPAGKKADGPPTGPPVDPNDPPSPVDIEALRELLLEPIVINTDTLYPQIYVPFSEPAAIDDPDPCENVLPGSVTYPYPVIVPEDGIEENSTEVFEGYTYDTQGNLMTCGAVDECFAKRYEVWAVTINEGVAAGGSGITYTTLPGFSDDQAVYVENMTIKVDKESWIKGKSKVNITWAMSWDNGINPAVNLHQHNIIDLLKYRDTDGYGYTSYEHLHEVRLGLFSSREIRRQTQLALGSYFFVIGSPQTSIPESWIWNNIRNWYPSKGTYLYYSVYEFDTWADIDVEVPLVSTANAQGFTSILNVILSNNSEYIKGAIKISPVPEVWSGAIGGSTHTYSAENDQIKFNVKRNF